MRKAAVILIVTMILTSLFVTNISYGGEVDQEWTLIFYMGGDGNPDYISDAVDDDLEELRAVDIGDRVSIIVLADQKEVGDTRLIEIKDGELHEIPLSLVNASWGDELDMSSHHTLRDYVGWAKENYQAERYLLNLWGHGGGWRGMNLEDHTRLTLPDMSLALDNFYFDIIGFDSCTMGMFEVYYQLRNNAEIVIAAEKEVPLAGWPYTDILTVLKSEPGMNSTTLATVIVDEFVDWGSVYSGVSATLTAIETSRLPISELELYSSELQFVVPLYYEEIKLAWEETDSYTPFPHPRDLYHFSMNVHHNVESIRLREAGYELRDAINSSIVAHRVYSRNGDLENAHGLGIYLPSESVASEYDILDFGEHGWHAWLKRFTEPPEMIPDVEYEFSVLVQDEVIHLDFSHNLTDASVDIDVYLENERMERYSFLESQKSFNVSASPGHYKIEFYMIYDESLVGHAVEELFTNTSFAIVGDIDTTDEILISIYNTRTGYWNNFTVYGGHYNIHLSVPGFCEPGDVLSATFLVDDTEVHRDVVVDGEYSVVDIQISEGIGYGFYLWILISQAFIVMMMALSYYKRKRRTELRTTQDQFNRFSFR